MSGSHTGMFKKLLFFWLSSVMLAIAGYYLLWLVMPGHRVFGAWYRMYCYHYEHPIPYILILCFFYGIISTLFSGSFSRQNTARQVFTTVIIFLITIAVSMPFGGMLWHYHDMRAGYFPDGWVAKMVLKGAGMGFSYGWFIVLLSLPYNLLGIAACFFLTRKGAALTPHTSARSIA